MATVTEIATAISTQLLTLSDVDYVSVSEFTPAISTEKIAAFVVPFEQETTGDFLALSGSALNARHRLRCEFWVKHTAGNATATAQRARDVSTLAMIVLMQNNGTGYQLDTSESFTELIDDQFVTIDQTPFLVASLSVPVRNTLTL